MVRELILFEFRKDQFCIEVETKVFHIQVDLWNKKTKEYIDTIPLCNTTNTYSVGNLGEEDKISCSQCNKYNKLNEDEKKELLSSYVSKNMYSYENEIK